jgi:CHAD domain-containing protein
MLRYAAIFAVCDNPKPGSMDNPHEELIARLQAQIQPIVAEDPMAEAGRKALLNDLVKMLHHEAGSRLGEDIEEVHDMRVAIRRQRSTLRLLEIYYKPKAIQPYLEQLRRVAQVLGAVRDLDVLIHDLHEFQATLDPAQPDDLQSVFDQLDEQRALARHDLLRLLDKKSYQRFINDYADFLTTPGKGARPVETHDVTPYQVRHLLPTLLYEHLGAVRAYDTVLAEADAATLHALRIEFKRLRYVVSIFTDVLGSTINDFITELKTIQDHLGRLNDIRTAQDRLSDLIAQLDPETQGAAIVALQAYIDRLEAERLGFGDSIADLWQHFNTKTVQRQLAMAAAGL